jgi:hypothetical protein
MPTISIDTFFACSLLVSVALIGTAFLAGTMETRIDAAQNLYKDGYLKAIAEHIISSYGAPVDWGSMSEVQLGEFGLADADSSTLYELDIDKVSRLNDQNNYSLAYIDVSKASRLNDIALGVSVSQPLSIAVTLSDNQTAGDATMYTFAIEVSCASGPVSASLHCYVVAKDFVDYVSNDTSSSGIGYISVQIPNSSNGSALLVVFARPWFDDRLTSYEVYSFPHLSEEPLPNHSFLGMSTLNYTLYLNLNFPEATVQKAYAFSFNYQLNLTSISDNAYAIPAIIDKGPIIPVVCGTNDTTSFIEWTSYPNVPLEFGANFENSEKNVFAYAVTIKGTLYKLVLTFGDMNK